MEAPDTAAGHVRTATRRPWWAVAVTAFCAAAALLLFLQPWVSCDYEDTSAGCASTPLVAGLLMAAVAGTGAGLLITLGLALSWDAEISPRRRRRHASGCRRR